MGVSVAAVVGLEESVDVVEVLSGVPAEGADGGFEGVFVADGVGVEADLGAEAWILSLSSPYSFHSSTSSRSCEWNQSAPKLIHY